MSRRFHDAADIWIAIEEAPGFVEPAAGIPKISHSSIWIVSIALLAIIAALCLIYIFRGAPAAQPMRFTVGLPPNISLAFGELGRGSAVFSPDGTQSQLSGVANADSKKMRLISPIGHWGKQCTSAYKSGIKQLVLKVLFPKKV